MAALRPFAIPPGDYMAPRPASRDDMRSPAFAEKMKSGPVVMMTVFPNGPMSMSRNFVLWFAYGRHRRCSRRTWPATRCHSAAAAAR